MDRSPGTPNTPAWIAPLTTRHRWGTPSPPATSISDPAARQHVTRISDKFFTIWDPVNLAGVEPKKNRPHQKMSTMTLPQPARAKHRPRPSEAVLRNANLQKYFHIRYRKSEWPDDDAGAGDLWLAIHSLTTAGKDDRAVRAFIKPRASWLSERDTVAMLDRAYAKPKPYSATKLGQELGLTDVERTKYQIWHIEAIDVPKAVRVARGKRRRIARQKRRRHEHGAIPHEMSAAQKQPWLDHRMPKHQYYRWIEKFEKAIAAQGQVACNKVVNKMKPCKLLLLDRSWLQSIDGIVTAQAKAA